MTQAPESWEQFKNRVIAMVSDTLVMTAQRYEEQLRRIRETYEAEREKDREMFIEVLDAAVREIRALTMTVAACEAVEKLRDQLKAGDTSSLTAPEGLLNAFEAQREEERNS